MKITKIEMIYPQEGTLIIEGEPVPCIWVRIHTDEGITGLGETYPLGEAECGVIRGRLASMLIGQNPLEIERLWQEMFHGMRVHGWAGAELRAISAIDIALWDIYGKVAGQPIYQLLGGKSRESVRRHYLVQYDNLVTGSVPVEEGHLTMPEAPGLGIDLKPELLNAPGIETETISG